MEVGEWWGGAFEMLDGHCTPFMIKSGCTFFYWKTFIVSSSICAYRLSKYLRTGASMDKVEDKK